MEPNLKLKMLLQQIGSRGSNAGMMEPNSAGMAARRRWRLRFSLRGLLVAMLLLSVALAGYRAATGSVSVAYTGRSLDVAICGPGYFAFLDTDRNITYFTRDGRFCVDPCEILCVEYDGRKLHLDPTITVPSDALDVRIAADGAVYATLPGGFEQQMGCLAVAMFSCADELNEVSPGTFRAEYGLTPVNCTPGERGSGHLAVRWREVGRRGEDLYALLYVPSLLLAFVVGSCAGALCVTASRTPHSVPGG